jgi:nucleoside phosphorylase
VKIRDEATREKFVDMESYGFEMVCDSFSLPRIILKVPVDKI